MPYYPLGYLCRGFEGRRETTVLLYHKTVCLTLVLFTLQLCYLSPESPVPHSCSFPFPCQLLRLLLASQLTYLIRNKSKDSVFLIYILGT